MELSVEVAYALPDRAAVVRLTVERGTTLRQVIEQSGLLQRFPEIDLARCKVGVFGELRELDAAVEAGDRIEIYRPLTMDPKDRRRRMVSS